MMQFIIWPKMKILKTGLICLFTLQIAVGKAKAIIPGKIIHATQWCAVELTFTSSKPYTDPFNNVDMEAVFTGPRGRVITRPAFWDGGNTWRVRFAPTCIGKWKMRTKCTDTANTGLNGKKAVVLCLAYSGPYAIYKHGFLKISANKRYFVYNDGKPFFYLGDTHWIMPHERFATSNVEGVASQFKYTVDKRVKQGFTVYQSEPIQQVQAPGSHDGSDEEQFYNLDDGFTAADLPGFANLDRKFKYIADKGLVHANAQLTFVAYPAKFPGIYTDLYLKKLARYWVARYGAYPVLWTTAQESDTKDSLNNHIWGTVAETVAANDSYHQPLTLHMQDVSITNASNSWFQGKSYHTWRAVQLQYNISSAAKIFKYTKDFWNSPYTQPTVDYESGYEAFQGNTTKDARAAGYRAFQTGMLGIGYGANGIWNDLYTPTDLGTAYLIGRQATYLNWYAGANLPGATQLGYLKSFYTNIKWWQLTPRFDDPAWSSFTNVYQSLPATINRDVFVVYFFSKDTNTGTLKNLLAHQTYKAQWFNPLNGRYTLIGKFMTDSGEWTIPPKPDASDWVLLVKKIK
jgi:hypothetical protein